MTDIRRPIGAEVGWREVGLGSNPSPTTKKRISRERLLLRDGARLKLQTKEGIMTNASERDQLMSLLFGGDTKLLDLKFFRPFPGDAAKVTADDICREIRSAIMQKHAGTATVSKDFNDDASKIDVRTLLRS